MNIINSNEYHYSFRLSILQNCNNRNDSYEQLY